MKTLLVILTTDVKHKGKCGDEARVAAGFARNYLFPNSYAVPATVKNREHFNQTRKEIEALNAIKQQKAQENYKKCLTADLRFIEEYNERTGHLYGAISAKQIVENLKNQGIHIEASHVGNTRHLKTVGSFKVRIDFHGDLTIDIPCFVGASDEEVARIAQEYRVQEGLSAAAA